MYTLICIHISVQMTSSHLTIIWLIRARSSQAYIHTPTYIHPSLHTNKKANLTPFLRDPQGLSTSSNEESGITDGSSTHGNGTSHGSYSCSNSNQSYSGSNNSASNSGSNSGNDNDSGSHKENDTASNGRLFYVCMYVQGE